MQQLPKITTLHHVALVVDDLEQASEFYRSVLGLKEIPPPSGVSESGIRWFDLGEDRALHLIQDDLKRQHTRAHFALAVEDVDGWRSRFERLGIPTVAPKVTLYSADRVFVRDPSGNLLELVKWLT